MKTIILTTVIGAFLAVAGGAQAASYTSDPLLQDYASTGQIITPHGFSGSR